MSAHKGQCPTSMGWPCRACVGRIKDEHPVGTRVRLVNTDDEYTHLEPGTLGTVTLVDDAGTVHVAWDSGSRLGMAALSEDRFELLERL